jgi:hypothetical protein
MKSILLFACIFAIIIALFAFGDYMDKAYTESAREDNIKLRLDKIDSTLDRIDSTIAKMKRDIVVAQSKTKENRKAIMKSISNYFSGHPDSILIMHQIKSESANLSSKAFIKHNNFAGIMKNNQIKHYTHWKQCMNDYLRILSKQPDRARISFIKWMRSFYGTDLAYFNKYDS